MSAKSLKTVRYGQHRREIACDADIQQRIHLQKVETKTVGFGPKGLPLSGATPQRCRLIGLTDLVRLNLQKHLENQCFGACRPRGAALVVAGRWNEVDAVHEA